MPMLSLRSPEVVVVVLLLLLARVQKATAALYGRCYEVSTHIAKIVVSKFQHGQLGIGYYRRTYQLSVVMVEIALGEVNLRGG